MRGRPATIARFLLVAAVLVLHFETRLWTHLTIPLEQKHFWPSSYLVSLSLLSGHGFSYLLPTDASTKTSVLTQVTELRNRPGAVGPVMDFLSGKGRQELSRPEFADYLASGVKAIPIDLEGGLVQSRWEATRILDIRLAATLFRIFGIRWSVLFAFYSAISALAAFLLFFMVRSLTGSYWGGLLALLGFLASPLERVAGARSIRDANPIWFAIIAFYLLFRLASGSSQSRVKACLGWLAIGAGSALGLGWRSDALLLPPFILVALLALLAARRVPLRNVALAGLLCVAGALTLRAVVDWLGPASRGQGGDVVFHIAWYGEHIRSDLLGTENAFQIKQDDYVTLYQANYFRQQRTGETTVVHDIYDPRHFATIRSMYLELVRYDAYGWWRMFPGFLWQTMHVDRAIVPGASGGGLPIDDTRLPLGGRSSWLQPLYAICLRPYVAWLPLLFLAGLGLGLLRAEARVPTLLLGGYFVYYSAALLMVLPESKHWPPLLLPLHVIAASGLWWAVTALRWLRRPIGIWKGELYWFLAVVALATCGWVAAGWLAHGVSRAQRARILGAVRAAAASAPEESLLPDSNKLFSVSTGEAANDRVGYLFRIRGAPQRAVDLYCIHLREPTARGSTPLYYYTRHRLQAGREQLFFVNLVTGTNVGDDRPYTLHVRVRGRAELLSVRRLDLTHWSAGMPLSVLFTEGETLAASEPLLDKDQLPVTDEFLSREQAEAFVRPQS